jgi:hypothetical protein
MTASHRPRRAAAVFLIATVPFTWSEPHWPLPRWGSAAVLSMGAPSRAYQQHVAEDRRSKCPGQTAVCSFVQVEYDICKEASTPLRMRTEALVPLHLCYCGGEE